MRCRYQILHREAAKGETANTASFLSPTDTSFKTRSNIAINGGPPFS
ncbi:hypothetical protein [Aggregatimonas sangjinii]|nr:hypothetical protein [Aggregatimonas sangjinii]